MPELSVEHLDPCMRFIVNEACRNAQNESRYNECIGAVPTHALSGECQLLVQDTPRDFLDMLLTRKKRSKIANQDPHGLGGRKGS